MAKTIAEDATSHLPTEAGATIDAGNEAAVKKRGLKECMASETFR